MKYLRIELLSTRNLEYNQFLNSELKMSPLVLSLVLSSSIHEKNLKVLQTPLIYANIKKYLLLQHYSSDEERLRF